MALVLSLKEYTRSNAKNIFWGFCIFYGLTFAIGIESSGSDINRYLEELEYLHSRHEFTNDDIVEYFDNSGEVDVLRTFIAYVISRFSDSQAILLTVFATIFGFFYSRNIFYLLNLLEGRIDVWTKLMIFGLILVVPIWMINGFRMWTAFHVFFYGLIPFIFENKKSKLVFVYLSFLVHFSFIIPILLFSFYLLIGSRVKLFFIGFVISLFISEINLGFLNQYIERYAPQSIVERTSGYRSEESIENRKRDASNKKTVWYVLWHRKLLRWFFYISLFYFFLFASPMIKYETVWKRLFSITLLFFSVANLSSLFPSGGRFLNFALFTSFMMVIFYLNRFGNDHRYKSIVLFLSPCLILFLVVSIRIGLYSTSVTTVLGNPIIALINTGETVSINDILKY